MSTSLDTGRARAWAWVAHLRAGGTTPWAAWETTDPAEESRFLPGAQQLELLRRLNAAGRPSATLVERVLTASAPGRGRPDLELVGVDEERRFGPPPVDPATLPDEELLRVATGLLAEDVLAADAPAAEPRPPRRLRVRYQLAGDPWLAAAHTRALTADGRPPGGQGRAVHVLGCDVATMLAHTWGAGAFGPAAPSWPDFLARVRARRRLPERLDLPGAVARFEARPHTGRVGVVLDPAALPRLVGVRRLAPAPEVAVHATELARQVGTALSLHVVPAEQARLLTERLLPRLAREEGPRPVVPPEHRDWVEDAGFALRQRLLRARYPVVGDADAVLAQWSGYPGTRVSPRGWAVATPQRREERPNTSVLDLAIDLLLEEDR
ncbi:hypothetical protein G5V58_23445 [Nocardioides anomalus]|uniref:Uncharacterized protein n=1 Tax=Nocardioides anomalus TaxID=2712223 RepID=A0A6G6WJB9_9ACTN|nr:hypothetical protein [Nocardioides anomalus]QIG45312.1 hypothetical protein G5V58_23445 [Nocardioides anomalus]